MIKKFLAYNFSVRYYCSLKFKIIPTYCKYLQKIRGRGRFPRVSDRWGIKMMWYNENPLPNICTCVSYPQSFYLLWSIKIIPLFCTNSFITGAQLFSSESVRKSLHIYYCDYCLIPFVIFEIFISKSIAILLRLDNHPYDSTTFVWKSCMFMSSFRLLMG